jgi:glucosamine-6-phosphate deaminase
MDYLPEYLLIPAAELAQVSKVALKILPDLPALYQHFARSIADEIQENNRLGKPTRLILPVGPLEQYPVLVEICNRERISWKNVYTFNMDEYCDWQGRAIPATHPLSFRGFIQKNLFERLEPDIRIPATQIHFPDPLRLDWIGERIQAVGGIDTCYGGIGYHGHVAFNEAPISRWFQLTVDQFRNSLTRLVQLEPETIVMNSIRSSGGNPAAMPPMAVTLGMQDIFNARRIRLYCQGGSWQRTVLRIAVMGEESVGYPVTLLQRHPDYAIITDENTAVPPIPQAKA